MRPHPGCPSWISSRTCARSGGGITTLAPQSMHPSSVLSSSFLWKYGAISLASTLSGQPCNTYFRTLASTGSLSVQILILAAVTSEASSLSMSKMVSAGCGTSWGVVGSGSLLSPSALPCSLPGRYTIEYWYPLRVNAHLCTQADAVAEIA